MNRIVNDASRRVRALKRQQSCIEEDDGFASQNFHGRSPAIAKNEDQDSYDSDENADLSNFGDFLEWSPKRTPAKRKKKGFVRLSSYEGACFS